jgi:hypothetical protein
MAFDNATLSTVADIRRTYRMVVPEYQRGYAWGPEQWRALWDDAVNLEQRNDREHYAGTMMVSVINDGAGGLATAELIDGQQRWTSMALMLSALGDEAYPVQYRDNESLQTYFDYHALGQQHLGPRLAEFESYYTRNLGAAAQYFRQRASDLSQETRTTLTNTLLQRFKIFVLGIRPSFDIHVAFEAINNRGKPLSTLEKLKNRLIFLAANASDGAAGGAANSEIHRCWKGVYKWLGQGRELLDDDDFLRAHALGWFRHQRKADWLTSQLFDNEFDTKAEVAPDKIVQYVRSLERAALWWYRLHEPNSLPGEPVGMQLVKLQRTPWASSKPLLLWALLQIADQIPGLDANPISNLMWCNVFKHLAFQTERFGVLVLLANAMQANVGQSDMNLLAHSLARSSESFRRQNAERDLPSLGLAAVQHAGRYVQALVSNRQQETDNFRDPEFGWPGYFEPSRVSIVVADRLRKQNGFYQWRLGKLMIYLWEEHLRGKGLPEKKSWESISWDESVEHIYPQNPHPAWSKDVSFDGRTSASLRGAVTNSLGNLLLLSGPRNAGVSNHPYQSEEKLPGKHERYAQGSYSEVQVAMLCKQWTVVQIAARGIAMWRHAQRNWEFEVVADNARLIEWFPLLFGDQSEKILAGAASGGQPIDGRTLQPWVQKFEEVRPR